MFTKLCTNQVSARSELQEIVTGSKLWYVQCKKCNKKFANSRYTLKLTNFMEKHLQPACKLDEVIIYPHIRLIGKGMIN